MSATNSTNFAPLLKEYYTPEHVRDVSYQNHPFFAMVPKKEDWSGKNYVVPVIFDQNTTSSTFSFAQSNRRALPNVAFSVTSVDTYSTAEVTRKTIRESAGKAAFLEAATAVIDNSLLAVSRSVAYGIYRTQAGSIGNVGAVSGTQLTLAEPENITSFTVGQVIVAAAVEDSGALRVGSAQVTAIDGDNGILFSGSDWTAQITGLVAGDFLFNQGDRTDSQFDLRPAGLGSWVPTTAPTSTPFFGVDRSISTTKLGGVRLTGTENDPIEETLIQLASRVYREGGRPRHALINNAQYSNLEKSLQTQRRYFSEEITGRISFDGLVLHGPVGDIKVFSDPDCPPGLAYMLTMDTWKLISVMGPAVGIFDMGTDQEWLRLSASDSYEVRLGGYYNLVCSAPAWNGVAPLPTLS